MVINYKTVKWEFARGMWSRFVARLIDVYGMDMLVELTELSDTSFLNWANGYYHPDAPHPNMTNLLKLCNLTDTDPRVFFETEE